MLTEGQADISWEEKRTQPYFSNMKKKKNCRGVEEENSKNVELGRHTTYFTITFYCILLSGQRVFTKQRRSQIKLRIIKPLKPHSEFMLLETFDKLNNIQYISIQIKSDIFKTAFLHIYNHNVTLEMS